MANPRVPEPPTPPPGPPPGSAPDRLHRLLEQLGAATERAREAGPPPGRGEPALDPCLSSLRLAEAALRHRRPPPAAADLPPQVVVLGPTQTGKSTLVNLLTGRPLAAVSPLAGFTVHPQGFWAAPGAPPAAWVRTLLPGWTQRAPADLSRDDLRAFALAPVPPAAADGLFHAAGADLPACVLWDTPDFDSLAARHYERGVLELAALADLYLLVLSKEKYSDLAVWRLLGLLEPLARPLLICVNKLPAADEATVLRSLRERLAQHGPAWGDVPIVVLPYEPALAAGRWGERPELAGRLRAALRDRLGAASPRRRAGVVALLRRHWEAWLAPVRAEHAAIDAWNGLVDGVVAGFLESYRRDYLDHPERYDSFRRATLELLELLELPRVGRAVAAVRRTVTRPARWLLNTGRTWWGRRRPPRPMSHSLGAEAGVLLDALDTLLTGLQRDVARRAAAGAPGAPVWQALEARLLAEQPRLRDTLEAAVTAHHEQVTREIRTAARELYQQLQRHPGRLAALRAGRATLDAGYLLLAVKSGGLTLLDAVWAPATFALTSLLMEGLAGLELGRAARGLKQRQWEAVATGLARRVADTLRSLADDLSGAGLFGLSPAAVADADQALAAWESGGE